MTPEQVHPRDLEMENAAQEILTYLREWQARWKVTHYEFLFLLTQIIGRELQRSCLVERAVNRE